MTLRNLGRELRARRRAGATTATTETLDLFAQAPKPASPREAPPPAPSTAAQPSLRSDQRPALDPRASRSRAVEPGTPLDAGLAAVAAVHPGLARMLCALDPAQLAAVFSLEPAALVRAQVGSGKTTVLVHKVLYLHLVVGVPLRKIAVLTFTTKAAGEIRERLATLGPADVRGAIDPDETWLMGTFHGVARALLAEVLPIARLGRRRGFEVIDDDERTRLIEGLIDSAHLRVGRKSSLPRRLQELKNGGPGTPSLLRLVELYEAQKRADNLMDFDDLLEGATSLLTEVGPGAPFLPEWLLVDEAQDCEPRETRLVSCLRAPDTRLFAVGDPLQSIYGWRGSSPDLFASIARERAEGGPEGAPAVYELPSSYRSTRNILEGARAVLGVQPIAAGALVPVREAGPKIVVRRHHDPMAEVIHVGDRIEALGADGVAPREIAVLTRLRSQLELFRKVLVERGLRVSAEDEDANGVRLLTLHAAKGLELRAVFISGVNWGLVPFIHGSTSDEEERRLLFVGMTRARDHLELGFHACPTEPKASGFPSPFLDVLPATLVEWRDGPDAPAPAAIPRPAAPPTPAPAPTLVAPQPPWAEPPRPAGEVAPSAASETGAPWRAGQAVRHARYGLGTVARVENGTVECDFGKLGPRAFPLKLCPLQPA